MSTQPVFKFFSENPSYLPQKYSDGAVGYDVFLPEDLHLPPFTPVSVDLKIKVEAPKYFGLLICARSSLAQRGLAILGGVIDEDFRGSIHCILANVSNQGVISVKKGERIV